MFRKSVLGLATSLLAGTFASACGGTADEAPGTPESPVLGKSLQKLSGADICNAINSLGTIDLGAAASVTPMCFQWASSNFSYLGSTAPASFAKSMSKVEAQSLYCALKSSDNAKASALSGTTIGTFGVESKVNIYKTNPAAMTLSGQRLATVYAFGVGMTLDNQNFDWQFPTEHQPAQNVLHRVDVPPIWIEQSLPIPAHTGQYAISNTNMYTAGIAAHATFPIGPFVSNLDLSFGNAYAFEAFDGRAYAMGWTGVERENARRASWQNMQNACNTCLAQPPVGGLKPICNMCPSSTDITQHNRRCNSGGCNDAFYTNLGDGRLPHENRRGASGSFFDSDGYNYGDFWHYGRPGAGANAGMIAPTEPVHSVAANGNAATTALDVSFGLKYDVGVADIGVTVHMDTDFRSGVAVRGYRTPFIDVSGRPRVTEVGVDAQSAFGIDARLVVNVDIPFWGYTNVLDERFDIIPRTSKQSPANVPSRLTWDGSLENAAISTYTVNGAATSTSSCLSVPPVTEAPEQTQNPVDFIKAVKKEIPKKLFPCNIKICTQDSPGSSTTTLRQCNWNATTQSVTCTVVGTGCACHATTAALCDGWGKVYPAKSTTHPACSLQPPH
jgi:hypothetical protein